jgi:hypothetical protein
VGGELNRECGDTGQMGVGTYEARHAGENPTQRVGGTSGSEGELSRVAENVGMVAGVVGAERNCKGQESGIVEIERDWQSCPKG